MKNSHTSNYRITERGNMLKFSNEEFSASFDAFMREITVEANTIQSDFKHLVFKAENIPLWLSAKMVKELFASTISFIEKIEFCSREGFTFIGTYDDINLDLQLIDKHRLSHIMDMSIDGWKKISLIGGITYYVSNPPLQLINDIGDKLNENNNFNVGHDYYTCFMPDFSQTIEYSKIKNSIERMEFQEFSNFTKGIHIALGSPCIEEDNKLRTQWLNTKNHLDFVKKHKAEENKLSNLVSQKIASDGHKEIIKPPKKTASKRLTAARKGVFGSCVNLESLKDNKEIEYIVQEPQKESIEKIDTTLNVSFDRKFFTHRFNKQQELNPKTLSAILSFAREIAHNTEIAPVSIYSQQDFINYFSNIQSNTRNEFKIQYLNRVLNKTNFINRTEDSDIPMFSYLAKFLEAEEYAEFHTVFERKNELFDISSDIDDLQAILYIFIKERETSSFDDFVDMVTTTSLGTRIGEDKVFDSVLEYFAEENLPLTVVLSLAGIEI